MNPEDLDATRSTDLVTLIALAVLTYFLGTIIHEAIGHGLTCTLVHGKVLTISSVHCECDYQGISRARERAIEAGGTVANLIAGTAFLAALLSAKEASPGWRYFFWLSAMVNLFQAGGYLMVSPFGGFGDWSAFLDGMGAQIAWKLGLTALGLAVSGVAMYFGLREFEAFCGGESPVRTRQAWLLTALPYAVGAIASCTIALANPVNRALVVTSAGAATLGGTVCLLWIGYLTGVIAPKTQAPAVFLPWNTPVIVLALLALGLWAFVLGPGASLSAAKPAPL